MSILILCSFQKWRLDMYFVKCIIKLVLGLKNLNIHTKIFKIFLKLEGIAFVFTHFVGQCNSMVNAKFIDCKTSYPLTHLVQAQLSTSELWSQIWVSFDGLCWPENLQINKLKKMPMLAVAKSFMHSYWFKESVKNWSLLHLVGFTFKKASCNGFILTKNICKN